MKESITYALPIIATTISIIVSLYSSIKYFNQTKNKKEELNRFLKSSTEFKELQKSLVDTKQVDEKEVLKDFEDINNVIKNIFDEITNSNCRTTIKVISYDQNVPVVISLVSQKEFLSRQAIYINKTNLFDDTSLSILLNKPFEFYCENDLTKYYKNIQYPIKKNENDSLFYSTLVIPIISISPKKNNSENIIIYGFLSIDSDRKNAFNKDLHVSVGKSFANSLLPFIENWTSKIKRNDELENSAKLIH